MKIIGTAMFALALGSASVVPAMAHGGVSVDVVFPVPVVEVVPPPRRGYVWVAGHWEGGFDSYVWVPGTWILASPGHRWVPHHRVRAEPRWHLHGGREERAQGRGHAYGHHRH